MYNKISKSAPGPFSVVVLNRFRSISAPTITMGMGGICKFNHASIGHGVLYTIAQRMYFTLYSFTRRFFFPIFYFIFFKKNASARLDILWEGIGRNRKGWKGKESLTFETEGRRKTKSHYGYFRKCMMMMIENCEEKKSKAEEEDEKVTLLKWRIEVDRIGR